MKKEKVVLAFSGGLDTSFCAKYLTEDCGYELYTAIANTGGFSKEELKSIEERAYKLGATEHASLDITQEYYDMFSETEHILSPSVRNVFFRQSPLSITPKRSEQIMSLTAVPVQETIKFASTLRSKY